MECAVVHAKLHYVKDTSRFFLKFLENNISTFSFYVQTSHVGMWDSAGRSFSLRLQNLSNLVNECSLLDFSGQENVFFREATIVQ